MVQPSNQSHPQYVALPAPVASADTDSGLKISIDEKFGGITISTIPSREVRFHDILDSFAADSGASPKQSKEVAMLMRPIASLASSRLSDLPRAATFWRLR